MIIDLIAKVVGYVIIFGGGLALAFYLIGWLVGKIIKWTGYWPRFIKTLYRMAKEDYERKRQR